MHRHRIISWQTPDHDLPEKPVDWYISVTIIGIAVAIASIFVNNLLFAIFALLATVSLMIHVAKKPEIIDIHLTSQGVEIKHNFYPYSNLHSFWIDHKKNKDELILHSDRAILPHLIIPIRDVPTEVIRLELRQHLVEKFAHKNLVDKLLEYFEF